LHTTCCCESKLECRRREANSYAWGGGDITDEGDGVAIPSGS